MFEIRPASPENDPTIAQHLRQLALDVGTPSSAIRSDWQELSLEFIRTARQFHAYQSFLALVDEQIVGSAGCQLYSKPYPQIWTETFLKLGYIWGVYVEPAYRGQGVGKALTDQTVQYLQSLNCTKVVLHTSPFGDPVYRALGFTDSNEMVLDLARSNC
jgi:ribosomal protein S18 acetylase RimI-like enzyme